MKKGYVVLILSLLLVITLLVGGCKKGLGPEPPSAFIQGEVVWVNDNLATIETDRIGEPYFIFGVKTINGIYTIQLDQTDRGGSPGPQTIYNLATLIKPGIKVRFPTELYGRKNPDNDPMGFSKSRVGMLDPDDIEILP